MLRKNHPKPLQHGSRAAVLVSELRLPSPIVWFDRSLIEPIVSLSGPLTRPQSPPPSWWVMLRRSSPSSLCWDSTRTRLHPLPPTTTHSMVRSATSNIASNQRAEQVFLVFIDTTHKRRRCHPQSSRNCTCMSWDVILQKYECIHVTLKSQMFPNVPKRSLVKSLNLKQDVQTTEHSGEWRDIIMTSLSQPQSAVSWVSL